MDELKMKFMEVYPVLKAELLQDSAFEFTPDSRKWIDQMLDYNVPKGKLSRGLCVICSYKALREGQEIKDEEIFLACVLGWCIEWFQAHALVLDDIEDNSYLRRGQPCWYRKPEVGLIALNDGLILVNHVFRILKKHFKEKTYYVDLLDLFNEVVFQTISGQMIDLITAADGEEDLTKYTMPVYNRIVEYKSAYYSFYLPVAFAMILAGENIENHIKDKDIFVQLGTYFQIENDYMDCYGDPKVTGVVGTDIEDRKCSWLVVKALECVNEEQKKLLYENYGNTNPACVAKVKELYESLDLQGMYANFEKQALEKLARSVETHPSKAVQALWQVCVRRLVGLQSTYEI